MINSDVTSGFTGIEEWRGNLVRDEGAPVVLVLPGANHPAQLPGLALPVRALNLGGWRAFCATWTMDGVTPGQSQQIVDEAIAAFVVDHGLPDLVLAKSVGTRAAGWVADHGVPAIWTTPLLTSPDCVDALGRTTAAAVLVAGTKDRCWDDAVALRLGIPAVRVDGADHGWQTGDWRRELEVLGELCDAVAAFAQRVREPWTRVPLPDEGR